MADTDQPSSIDDQLDVVQITPDHIRSNGTLHSTPFAGIAELIDNAVDSNAKTVKISTRNIKDHETSADEQIIYVVDDGSGMDRKETLGAILVGHSVKRGDIGTIGQFGNGLKSGSMRIGETMLLVTKKDEEFTLLLISLKYLEAKQTIKCYAPCISLRPNMNEELVRLDLPEESVEKHDHALSIMLQYSPFKTKEDLFEFAATCFDGDSGTCVVLSDLKRQENGRYEMKYSEKSGDFTVDGRGTTKTDVLSRFLQRLYLKPKISICIQGRMVRMIDPLRQLVDVRWDYLAPKGLEEFSNREVSKLDAAMKRLTTNIGQKTNEERVKFKHRQSCENDFPPEKLKALDREIRMVQEEKRKLEEQKVVIGKRREEIQSKKLGGDLRVYVGIDLASRHVPRVMFYTNGRRIMTKDLDRTAKKKMELLGVVCIIDIPSTLLPPSQSRENFEMPGELGFLTSKINKIAKNYFLHADPKYKRAEFWADYGYIENCESSGNGTTIRAVTITNGASRMCYHCHKFREVEVDPKGMFPLPSLDALNEFFRCPRSIVAGECDPLTKEEERRLDPKQVDTKGKTSSYVNKAKEDDKIVANRGVAVEVQSPQRRTAGRREPPASRSPSPAPKKARRKRGSDSDDDYEEEENEKKPRRKQHFNDYDDDAEENMDSDCGQVSGPVSRRRSASSTNRRDTVAASSSLRSDSGTSSRRNARIARAMQKSIKKETESTLPLLKNFRIPKKGEVKREEEDSDAGDSDYCEQAKKEKQPVKNTEKSLSLRVGAVVRDPPSVQAKRGKGKEKETAVEMERSKMTSYKDEPVAKRRKQVKTEESSDEDEMEEYGVSSDDNDEEGEDESRKKRNQLVPRSTATDNGDNRGGAVEERRSRQSSMNILDDEDEELIALANSDDMNENQENPSYEELMRMLQEREDERRREGGALRQWLLLGRKRGEENDEELMEQWDEERRAIEGADDPLAQVMEIMNRNSGGRHRGGSEIPPSTVHHEDEIQEDD